MTIFWHTQNKILFLVVKNKRKCLYILRLMWIVTSMSKTERQVVMWCTDMITRSHHVIMIISNLMRLQSMMRPTGSNFIICDDDTNWEIHDTTCMRRRHGLAHRHYDHRDEHHHSLQWQVSMPHSSPVRSIVRSIRPRPTLIDLNPCSLRCALTLTHPLTLSLSLFLSNLLFFLFHLFFFFFLVFFHLHTWTLHTQWVEQTRKAMDTLRRGGVVSCVLCHPHSASVSLCPLICLFMSSFPWCICFAHRYH